MNPLLTGLFVIAFGFALYFAATRLAAHWQRQDAKTSAPTYRRGRRRTTIEEEWVEGAYDMEPPAYLVAERVDPELPPGHAEEAIARYE